MNGLIAQLLAWPTLGVAVLVFGFAPGVALRLIVLFYPRGNPRRQELLGELYAVPTIERPFWVAAQLEVALFEGLRTRFRAWRDKRLAKQAADRAVSDMAPASFIPVGDIFRADGTYIGLPPSQVPDLLSEDISKGWYGRGWPLSGSVPALLRGPGIPFLLADRTEPGLCGSMGPVMLADGLSDEVSLLRVLARRAPGGPPKA